ncbi:MAG: SpoIIE family protein phosphatase [Bacteroidia bacterium]|nr:SpoIIE family protein phosphatase [Bacteroidia bacterium]
MKRTPLTLLFSICLTLLSAQTYNFRVFGIDEGLANPYVYHITQDTMGFLYAATGDGLSVFGGNRFVNITQAEGLAENFINTQYLDRGGNLWLGHYQKGITVKHGIKFLDLRLAGLQSVRITRILEDSSGNFLISTFGQGVMSIPSHGTPGFITGLPSDMINDIEITLDGKLLVATNESFGVYRLNPEMTKAEAIYELKEHAGKNTQQIIRKGANDYFITVMGIGIVHLEYLQGECRLRPFNNDLFKGSVFDIRDGVIDNDGNLWLASFGEGLKKLIPGDDKFEIATLFVIDHENGLPTDHLQSLFFDREGNLWIGTYGKGLVQMINERFSLFTGFGTELDPGVYSACSDATGNLWIGTRNGLVRFVPGSRQNDLHPIAGIEQEKITALQPDNQGKIWAGSESGMLYVVDAETKKVIRHSLSGKSKYINTIDRVYDKLYIATSAGLFIINLKNGETETLTTNEGLLHNNVVNTLYSYEGKLWIASHETPPYFFMDGKAEVFNNVPGIRTFDLNDLAEDKDGHIWIATGGDGLFRYNGSEFLHYSIETGLGSNFCYAVVVDVNGNVWVTHKNGVSRMKRGETWFEHIGKSKGILSSENNLSAVYADPTGTVFFGTENGVVKYDPRKEKMNPVENKTSILGITLNGKYIGLPEDTLIEYGDHSVRIDFIGVCLSDPSQVRYRYILEGFDPGWAETDHTQRFISYPRLTDGIYTFRLLSRNNTGAWNKQPVTISFRINMPIWKRWYFFVFCAAIITTISILYTRMRTRRLVKQRQILQQQVHEQTLVIRREKEEVERINAIVEEKNRDITSSINYAVKIQEATLPKTQLMEKVINGIIFYRPRDIVSGDFFWYYILEDERLVVVAADCTGHGVPGAFVSLVGKMLLDKIIIERKITEPSKILKMMDEGIKESLHQKGEDLTSQDGMELALLIIDTDRKGLVFSTANRPVLVVRKGVLSEYSGSPFGIGGTYGKLHKEFGEERVELQAGDMIFIFSDGYADQFGGERGRKFSTKNLKNLLTETANSKLEEQRAIITGTFDRWKGEQKQIDDVLLIGIRI